MNLVGYLFGNPIYEGAHSSNEIGYNEILLEKDSDGKIILKQKQDDDLVVLTGVDDFISIDPEGIVNVSADTTSQTIEVESNMEWEVITSEGVTANPESGDGNAAIEMSFLANEDTENEKHNILTVINNSTGILESINVIQGAKPAPIGPPNDEIWYTSTDGNIVELPDPSDLGLEMDYEYNLISNTYVDGKGIMKFDQPIVKLGAELDESVMPVALYPLFANSQNLETLTIPDSVTSIGAKAFFGCTSLTSVMMPDGVTSIGDIAFADCSSLTSIRCLATTPPTGGERMFENTNNCPIYVPSESVGAYKLEYGWTSYEDRIQAIPEE